MIRSEHFALNGEACEIVEDGCLDRRTKIPSYSAIAILFGDLMKFVDMISSPLLAVLQQIESLFRLSIGDQVVS